MSLSVSFARGRNAREELTFLASDLTLRREVGAPVAWHGSLHVVPESFGVDEAQRLGDMLTGGPVYATPAWEGRPLGMPGVVIKLEYESASRSRIRLEAHASMPEIGIPDPFQPRRRVHRIVDFKQLLDRFHGLLKVSQSVANTFSTMILRDDLNAAVIQSDLSDWAFVFEAVRQYGHLQEQEHLRPLVVSGGCDDGAGNQGRWLLDWGHAKAYEELGQRRIVDASVDGGFEQLLFGGRTNLPTPGFPSGSSPVCMRQRVAREFEFDAYRQWTQQDLPAFLTDSGGMVWMIEDSLRPGGSQRPERTTWTSRLHVGPSEAPAPVDRHVEPWRRPTPWSGFGVVLESSREGPWIVVRLHDFEQGEDELPVRIVTPYAGTDGRRGVHAVPEQGTEVLLAWSGRFGDSIVCIGNTRSEAASLASPSLWLDDELLVHARDVRALALGRVVIEPGLEVHLESESAIEGEGKMELDIDGTEVRLAGGTFYSGKS